MNLEDYPKETVLKDGSRASLRPMVREDEKGLLEYFRGLAEGDRLYLRDNVTDPDVVRSWTENINYDRVLPILAIAEDRIVGNATLHRHPFSWMRHVGTIRITVSPDFRKKGLARILAAEIFRNALASGLQKLVAEMLTDQDDARRVFTRLGFREEAILKDHVLDVNDGKHDLLIMSNDLNLLWTSWMEFSESVSGTWDMED